MATAKKAAAKKTTDSSNSSSKTEAPGAADMLNPMKNLKAMTDRLQELNLTGGASKLLESGQKDLQALMQANEKSYQGLEELTDRPARRHRIAPRLDDLTDQYGMHSG